MSRSCPSTTSPSTTTTAAAASRRTASLHEPHWFVRGGHTLQSHCICRLGPGTRVSPSLDEQADETHLLTMFYHHCLQPNARLYNRPYLSASAFASMFTCEVPALPVLESAYSAFTHFGLSSFHIYRPDSGPPSFRRDDYWCIYAPRCFGFRCILGWKG